MKSEVHHSLKKELNLRPQIQNVLNGQCLHICFFTYLRYFQQSPRCALYPHLPTITQAVSKTQSLFFLTYPKNPEDE